MDEGYVELFKRDLQKAIHHINHMNDFLVPRHIALNCSIETQIRVGKMFKKFYFKNAKISSDDFDSFIKYLSMEVFLYGAIQLAKFWSKQNEVYYYNFACKTERNFMGEKYAYGVAKCYW